MARLEQTTPMPESRMPPHSASTDATRERDVVVAESNGMLPLVAILTALAFAASAWFFYHQGQNDSPLGAASSPTPATEGATPSESTELAPGAIATSANVDPASATAVQSPSYGDPDIVVTVHPNAAQMQAPAAKPRLAKAIKPAKPAPIVAKAGIDRQVALTSRPQPVYPAQAMRAHEQGTVLVLAQVDVNGHVSDARVVKRSGSNILDRAAPNEVRRWKFSPALHDGQPIVASVEVPVSYRIDQ